MNHTQPAAPDRVAPDRVTHFDFMREASLGADPYAAYKALQDSTSHELLWSTANGGHWIVTRNDAIIDMLQTPELFSNMHTGIPPQQAWVKLIPEELDPPEHTKYRALINPRLGPALMRKFDSKARGLARSLIDEVYPAGRADLMQVLTIPLPCSIFLEMVGLSAARTREFVEWKNELFLGGSVDVKMAARDRIVATLRATIDGKRADPGDDLLSFLVSEAARIDGRKLNDDELMSYAFLFFIAGLDTVTSAMTSCLRYFAEHADMRERVIENPALIPDAIEEILRRYSVVNPIRTATRDVLWRGADIRAGDQFVAGSIFANLDEREFECPMRVDIERDSNRHIGFGGGPHRCAGSHLARVEMRAVMEEVLPRLHNLRLQPGAKLHYYAGSLVGLTSLPVEWSVR